MSFQSALSMTSSLDLDEISGAYSGRLILASNRLPVTIKHVADEEQDTYTFKASSGGLVSGLAGLLKTKEYLWYGWPGIQVPTQDMREIQERLVHDHSSIPVWFDDVLADKHYNGFSNEILWALLHYHPGEFTFNQEAWDAYKKVNRLFAERMMEDLRDDDIVWIHDYHLMLLPAYLRELSETKNMKLKIGWFLHTPWPSSEVYRILPVRIDVLQGILKADLVGFHTYDYVRHFLSSCNRLLISTTSPTTLAHRGRITHLGAFPIGIDPVKFAEGLNQPSTQERIRHFRERFRDAKLIIGCDRLDYIKAIPHKLHAFEHLLDNHPELVGQVQLVQIAIPSREDVPEYKHLRHLVNELVGQINSTYGSIDFQPVHLKHTSVPAEDLMALFAISDACLITSTRDGMNLVAYEYVACQEQRHGSLILSEFAGCAQSFANGAIIVNPWDTVSVANGLYKAVTLGQDEREIRHQALWSYVNKYTSAWWGESFIDELLRVSLIEPSTKRRRRSTITRDMGPKLQVTDPAGEVVEDETSALAGHFSKVGLARTGLKMSTGENYSDSPTAAVPATAETSLIGSPAEEKSPMPTSQPGNDNLGASCADGATSSAD